MITYQTNAINQTPPFEERQQLAAIKTENTATVPHNYFVATNMEKQTTAAPAVPAKEPAKYKVVERNQTFLEKMKEAVIFSRLGANKEQIDELKEKMAELEKLAAEGKISPKELEERMAALQEAMNEALSQERNRANKDTLES